MVDMKIDHDKTQDELNNEYRNGGNLKEDVAVRICDCVRHHEELRSYSVMLQNELLAMGVSENDDEVVME